MEIDVAVFLAAVIENAGGFIDLPFDTLTSMSESGEDKAVAFDLIDDGATIRLTVTEVPDDLA